MTIHIAKIVRDKKTMTVTPACGRELGPEDRFIEVAMGSNCMPCRSALLIDGPNKAHPVKRYQQWKAEPMPGAENMLAEIQKKRDGR